MKFNCYTPLALAFGVTIMPALADQVGQQNTITITEQASSSGLNLEDNESASSRLGLSLMDSPASIELITQQEIALKADYSAIHAVTRSTGFSSNANQGNGGTSMSVRGFSGHSSVVQAYDGTQMYVGAGTRTFPADTWTLEKIEVLRGPGSVANGVGAIGATINYVPKAARFGDIKNEVDVSVGSFNLKRIGLGSGGTLTDKNAYRINILHHESNGYFDNGDENKRVIAGSLLYQPNSDLNIILSFDYSEVEPSKYWGTPLVNGKIKSSTRENNYNIKDSVIEYKDWWPRVGVEWQLSENIVLRSDTYYLSADRRWRNVEEYVYNPNSDLVDRAFYLEILHEVSQIGNRTDFLFEIDTGSLAHKISVGAEVNQIDFTHLNNRPYGGSSSVSLDEPTPGSWHDEAQNETTKDFSSDTIQYAIFFEDNISISEQWNVVLGLRRDEYDYERSDFARSNGEEAGNIENVFSGTSWRVGLVFQPWDSVSFYAQFNEALDPVGSVLTSTNPDLKLAEGAQFEVGVKHSFWEDHLQYTVSIYDIEKKNLVSENLGGVSLQIGGQSSQGVELDLYLKALEVISIDFNIAFVDAKYDEFISDGTDFSGNTPRNISDMTANLWVNWQLLPKLIMSAGSRFVDERFSDHANTNATKLPGYLVYDANLQWEVNPDLMLSLRGKNLTDEESFVLSSYGATQWVLAEGRSIELGLNYRF